MIAIHTSAARAASIALAVLALGVGVRGRPGDEAELHLRAVFAAAQGSALEITLFRWPTDVERAPLLTALSAPVRPPAAAAPAAPAPARGRAGLAGRGRGAAAPPLSPTARLEAAIKAAPTCGYIWTGGVTGYSIKYAWRASADDGRDRIVLVTDRRLAAHAPQPAAAPRDSAAAAADRLADGDFTVIEMRLDGKGAGEAKASLDANVVVDADAKTLALDGYASTPTLLKVTR